MGAIDLIPLAAWAAPHAPSKPTPTGLEIRNMKSFNPAPSTIPKHTSIAEDWSTDAVNNADSCIRGIRPSPSLTTMSVQDDSSDPRWSTALPTTYNPSSPAISTSLTHPAFASTSSTAIDHPEQGGYDGQCRISHLDQWFHIKGTEHEKIFALPSLDERTRGRSLYTL